MVAALVKHRVDVTRRKRKLQGKKVNDAFVGSWF